MEMSWRLSATPRESTAWEYPRGKVIYESSTPLGFVRIAPDGKLLAFAQFVGEWWR